MYGYTTSSSQAAYNAFAPESDNSFVRESIHSSVHRNLNTSST